MTQSEKIKERIRKLLALASDKAASQGEVENAMAAAQALMMKYHIQEGDIKKRKEKKEVIFVGVNVRRPDVWTRKQVASLVADNFRCEVVYVPQKKGLCLFGVKEDVEIAKMVTEFCVERMDKCLRSYFRTILKFERTAGNKNLFWNGFIAGLQKRLENQVHQKEWALVVAKPPEVQQVKEDLSSRLNKVSTKSPDCSGSRKSYEKGVEEGQSTYWQEHLEEKSL